MPIPPRIPLASGPPRLPSARVRRPDHVLTREIAGESVLLDLERESYYGLDEVGTRIFEILDSSASIAEAVARLLEIYDVDAETLWDDLTVFVAELRAHGLIELDDA